MRADRVVSALLVALGVAWPGSPMHAQMADTLYLSLRDAVIAGRERSPGSLQAYVQAHEAHVRVGIVRSDLLPHVALQAYHVTESFSRQALGLAAPNLPPPTLPPILGPFQDQDARPSFTLRLLDIATIERTRAASTTATAADLQSRATGEENADSAARAYVELAAAEAFARLRIRLAAVTDTLLNDARARFNARLAGEIDVIRAQAESVTAASAVTRALSERDQARNSLLRLIEQPMTRPVIPIDTLGLSPTTAADSDDAAVAAAFSRRPEIQADEAQLTAARQSLRAARAAWLPTLQAQGDYGFNGRWLIGNGPDPVVRTQTLMVGARWDVFDGGSREANIEIGHAEVFQAQSRLHDLLERVENEVRNAATALREARQLATDAERRAELSDRELRDVRALYLRGLAADIDLNDAENRYLTAQADVVDALRTYNTARLALLRAIDRLDAL